MWEETDAPCRERQRSLVRYLLMSAQPARVPRVALSRLEAAQSLGMSLDSFERHVQPELKLIRRGSCD